MNNINITKQGEGFILVNGSVLDYDEYGRNIILLKHYLRLRVDESLVKEGFIPEPGKPFSWYLKEKDLEAKLVIRKRHKLAFL